MLEDVIPAMDIPKQSSEPKRGRHEEIRGQADDVGFHLRAGAAGGIDLALQYGTAEQSPFAGWVIAIPLARRTGNHLFG